MTVMALPKDYTGDGCSLARALEVVGERWTLLIVRDAFFGVRRFGDFAAHLAIPRAVLTHRLSALVAADVLAVVPGPHGHDEYALTGKGVDLWPVVRSLLAWGDDYYSEQGPRRLFRHVPDDGDVAKDGTCASCGGVPPVGDQVVAPGPGWTPRREQDDLVSTALARPHRLLTPVRG
jgi:DNA-binding HxlR family transcriptional regulator